MYGLRFMKAEKESRVFATCFLGFIILGLFRVCLHTPIHFDGSYFIFFNNFNQQYANIGDYSRLAGHFLFETPAVLYSMFGGTSIPQATLIYSLTVVFLPLGLLLIGYFILPRDKKAYALYALCSYSFLLIASLYFEVHEIHIANGLMWILASMLIKGNNKKSILWLFSFGIINLVFVFTYSMLFLILPAILFYLYKNRKAEILHDPALYIILISAALNFLLTIHHNSVMPGTSAQFLESFETFPYNFSMLAAAILLGLYFLSFLFGKYNEHFFVFTTILLMSYLFWTHDTFVPWHLYNGRTLGVIAAVTLFYAALLLPVRPEGTKTYTLVLSALIISSFYLVRWNNFQNEILLNAKSHTGLIKYDDYAAISPIYIETCTHWNSEMFSVLIQILRDEPISMIIKRHPSSEPVLFNSENGDGFVDEVRARGIKFSPLYEAGHLPRD
jgi:hypothetical protein